MYRHAHGMHREETAMGPNESVVRHAYERFAAGDMDHLFAVLSDDVVWKSTGNQDVLPFAGEWRGKDGVRDYFIKSRTDWDVPVHKPIEFIVHEDQRFAVRVEVEAVNKRTGGRIRLEKLDLLTMVDGKCTAYAELYDTALAERAAGHGPHER
jgi:uncharacterized protein